MTEIRMFDFDVRADQSEEHGHFLTGRPIVFDKRTDLGWYDEIIDRGALAGTDLKDVRFLINHNTDMIPLARSRNNNAGLTLTRKTMPIQEAFTLPLNVVTLPGCHSCSR